MMLPFDPILTPLIVIGVFVYYACKGSGGTSMKSRTKEEEWVDEVKRREKYVEGAKGKSLGKTSGGHDYIMWLYEHRQD